MESERTAKRLKKLEEILGQLRAGENVQNRKLQTWLTEDEYADFANDWAQQKEIRNDLKQKPQVVTEYEQLLRDAEFANNRAESFSEKKNAKAAKSMRDEADRLFEKALEFLRENVEGDYALAAWFDRTLDFEASGELGLSPQQMPRAITSRSLEGGGGGLLDAKLKKRDVKVNVVERAIASLTGEEGDNDVEEDDRAEFVDWLRKRK